MIARRVTSVHAQKKHNLVGSVWLSVAVLGVLGHGGVHRAHAGTGAAIDALVSLDDVDAIALADGAGGALQMITLLLKKMVLPR